ncbi:MAG: DUF1700 domain-containing protein [Fusobacteriaceae bacterium]|nr:DUF1700 domain-containing protein [Fusobacteriaceae bacterium]
MTKEKWIERLKKGLVGLSKEEIEDIVSDYNEYFYDAMEKGRNEEEITNSLGDPVKLSKQLKADSRIKTAQANMNIKNVLKATFAIVTLSLFNIIIMLGPITAIAGIIIGAGAAGVAFIGGGLISLFAIWFVGSKLIMGLGFAIAFPIGLMLGLCLSSLGLMILILDFWFGRWIFNILVKYFKFNFDIVRKTAD